MDDLTRLINDRLEILRHTVANLPCGGGLEKLRSLLTGLQNDISSFIKLIDKINAEKK